MKVVLLTDVQKLGRKYDVKDVSDGHALNFLIPRGLAQVATDSLVKRIEADKAKDTEKRKKEEAIITEKLSALEKSPIVISGKANDKGHLFAGINKAELAPEISRAIGYDIAPEFIKIEKPIKEVGEHTIEVKVGEKSIKCKIEIKKA